MPDSSATAHVEKMLDAVGIVRSHVAVRQFDTERIYVVSVPSDRLIDATEHARDLERQLAHESESVVVTVRALPETATANVGPVSNLDDPRVSKLIQLLTSRSRTSETQPSLSYVPNKVVNLETVLAARHHLIFGRRGTGKTALLLEARKALLEEGAVTAWVNVQPMRNEGIERTFLHVQEAVLHALVSNIHARDLAHSQFASEVSSLLEVLRDELDAAVASPVSVRRLVPTIQNVLRRAMGSLETRLYLFLDDFYYMPRAQQADLLELLHGSTRDANIWLKVTSIRHLTRWFRPSPPTGLQTGQDADIIDLDLSLQEPTATVEFLGRVLTAYCSHVGIPTSRQVITRGGLDRLVFASGGVPRDFLTLGAASMEKARSRSGSTVGASDVNQAAGDAARSKISELEDDLASNIGFAAQTYQALTRVREFCLDQKSFTYFRIDFRDKDRNPDSYGVLTRLLEVRLVHLVDASVSDRNQAGERSECYSLDLSQYSGSRLKHGLRVLDLAEGALVSKQTRVQGPVLKGDSSRRVLTILRGAPIMPLSIFADLVGTFQPGIDAIEQVFARRRSVTTDELVLSAGLAYEDVSDMVASLIDQGRVEEFDADGVPAYRLVK
jgi:hypothetical protein